MIESHNILKSSQIRAIYQSRTLGQEDEEKNRYLNWCCFIFKTNPWQTWSIESNQSYAGMEKKQTFGLSFYFDFCERPDLVIPPQKQRPKSNLAINTKAISLVFSSIPPKFFMTVMVPLFYYSVSLTIFIPSLRKFYYASSIEKVSL